MFRLPQQIKDQIPLYAGTVRQFLAGDLPAADFAAVRVPWGNYSQRGGRQFMARVRIPAGALTAPQLRVLALCAHEFGNGILHVTTRQDIQIHDIAADNILKIHERLQSFDLSSRGGGGNTVRNITACYLSGVCPDELFDVTPDANAATETLLEQETSFSLPRKFKIAFSGCAEDCARCLVNDVGLIAASVQGKLGYRVLVAGGMGARSMAAQELEPFVPREQVPAILTAVKNVFHTHGDRKNKHRNRLRFLVESIGLARFKELYTAERAKLPSPPSIEAHSSPAHTPATAAFPEGDAAWNAFLEYSVVRQKQNEFVTVHLRIPRGDLSWERAESLAQTAAGFEGILFRTTPDQNLCLTNVRASDLPALFAQLRRTLDDFLYPDTLLDIAACKGSRTCNLGVCNSPGLAEALERVIENHFIGKRVFELGIRINGCPNACGQHPLGAIAFVGSVRRVEGRPVPYYRLWLGGRVGHPSTQLGRDTGILLPARNVPGFLQEFLARVESELDPNDDVHDFLDRRGLALAMEIKAAHEAVPSYAEQRELYIDWGQTEEFSVAGLGPGECAAGP